MKVGSCRVTDGLIKVYVNRLVHVSARSISSFICPIVHVSLLSICYCNQRLVFFLCMLFALLCMYLCCPSAIVIREWSFCACIGQQMEIAAMKQRRTVATRSRCRAYEETRGCPGRELGQLNGWRRASFPILPSPNAKPLEIQDYFTCHLF